MGTANTKASLVLFLSVARDQKEREYTFAPTGEKFLGTQTNDAPLECLMQKAKENGRGIGSIFCITTKEAKELTVLDGKTSIEIFKDQVSKAAKKLVYCDTPTVYEIPYLDYEDSTLHKRQIAARIFEMIYRHTGSGSDMYIDYTGGYRDICLLMTSIIRYMEFRNIQCRMIIYSDLQAGILHEIHFIYDMFELVNSVDQFVTTGSASKLNAFYQTHESNEAIYKVTEAITDFSNNIRLCSLGGLDQSVIRLADTINALALADAEKNYYTALFQSLIPMIREKMYLDHLVEAGQLNYPVLIQWCLDNDLLQQALTLYVEKLPIYYFRNEYIPHILSEYDPDDRDLANKAASLLYEVYDVIADMPQTRLLSADMKRTAETWTGCRPLDRRLKTIVNADGAVDFRHAYRRLLNMVQKQKRSEGVYPDYYERTYTSAVPIDSVYNIVLNNGKEGCHYLLFDDYASFRRIPQRDSGTLNNYQKKEYAAELLAGDRTDMTDVQKDTFAILENRSYLCDILLYYLIAKMIRNHTNHATENPETQDETNTWKRLADHFSIRYDGSFQSVKKLLQEGLTRSLHPSQSPVCCTAAIRQKYESYFYTETWKNGKLQADPVDEDEALARLLERFGSRH